MTNEEIKTCFVIAPIGEDGSEIRKRSDQILRHIIRPVVEAAGYNAVRSDRDERPGIITSQVIQHLLLDQLVIADLTGQNPNVFYELAIRHAAHKPIVQIIERGETVPFDVSPVRTISVDHTDLDSAEECRRKLGEQITSVQKDPSLVDSPLRQAIDLWAARESGNPQERALADIMASLADLRGQISLLRAAVNRESSSDSSARNYLLHRAADYRRFDPELSDRVVIDSLGRIIQKEWEDSNRRQQSSSTGEEEEPPDSRT